MAGWIGLIRPANSHKGTSGVRASGVDDGRRPSTDTSSIGVIGAIARRLTGMTPRPLPAVPHQFGVFTGQQAAARGWTSDGVRHAVARGRADRLWRGVFAAPVTSDAAGRGRRRTQLAVAAALTNAGVLVSHGTGASLYGWPWWAPAPQACVTHDVEVGMTRAPGVHVHRARLGPFDRWQAGTVPVTSPARTVADVAREYGPEAGLCVADSAAHAGDVRPIDLQRAAAQARDWPGGRSVGEILDLVDPRAESVFETRSRWAMRRIGIPAPLTQVLLFDRSGVFVARVDFFWPEFGVVGEADGLGKYDGRGAVTAEKLREDDVRRLDLGVVRWIWTELDGFDVVGGRFWQAVDDQAPSRARSSRWTARQDPLPGYRHLATTRPVPLWELAGS